MSDERSRATRRGFLALAGGTALAGCGVLPNPLSSSPPELDGRRLAEVTSGDVPAIARTVPVAIEDDHVQRHVDRTRTLLSRAPLPFGEGEIPNGAMRAEVNAIAADARATVERTERAASPYEAVGTLRDARGEARTVATAWAYADEGLRREDLVDDADTLARDVAAFRDRWSYVGDDPVRALLVYGPVESLGRTAARNAGGRPENPRRAWRVENLVTVSEDAGALERGRAALADAAYLSDRLRGGLAANRDLGATFDAALAALLDTLETATADIDGSDRVSAIVDADIEDSPVRYPLQYLHSDLGHLDTVTDRRDRGDVASALLRTHREFTRLRAFEALRERVESGEDYAIERVADVAALRESAVAAIETALAETTAPGLSRDVLHNMAGLVENADAEFGPYETREQVPVDWVRRDVGSYVYATAVARATPGVSETVADALTD